MGGLDEFPTWVKKMKRERRINHFSLGFSSQPAIPKCRLPFRPKHPELKGLTLLVLIIESNQIKLEMRDERERERER